MEIDLVRLCAAANAHLIVDKVVGIDATEHRLQFESRPPLPFDLLSVGIGSVPTREGVESLDDTVLAIKPMQTFLERLTTRLEQVGRQGDGQPIRIVIVGGGAGGVEIAFCLPNRIRSTVGDATPDISLVTADESLISGTCSKTSATARRELERRGVHLKLGHRVTKIADGIVTLATGETIEADIALWATSAVAPPLLANVDLPKDDRGFLLTRPTLQCISDDAVFAVGDSGTIEHSRVPKAGVYAVRQGRFLWENLQRSLTGQPLELYEPQRDFLKLFNTGDGKAIGEFKGFTFHNRWAWKLKDGIDRKFMDKYQDYSLMPMESQSPNHDPAVQMRCAGCGGKVGGSVLSRVLERLEIPPSENVLLGLDTPDDAAIVRAPGNRPLTVTVDFFAAPLDDPYLVGRIAALNTASDVFALGAQPLAALASTTIPIGRPRQQEQLLFEVLAGGLAEFKAMGATLVGGHTIEGPQLTVGFTMLADSQQDKPLTKAGLRTGDKLVLTKPLGSGILLAAHMQARCDARWMDTLLPTMLLSNQHAAALVSEFDISGVTDVTGFGLASHLLEMLRASQLACELHLDAIPLLPGVNELAADGIESTLAPANRLAEGDMQTPESLRCSPAYAALFDPQTCGGLLLGVRESDVERVLKRLRGQSDVPAVVIGDVTERQSDAPRITVT
jgi:selenide,water dikinase